MQDKALKNSMSSNISVWLSNKLSGNGTYLISSIIECFAQNQQDWMEIDRVMMRKKIYIL